MKSLTQFIKESLIAEINDPRQLVDLYNDINYGRRQITEASANRLIKWLTECECAFITAFRTELKDVLHPDKTWFGDDEQWEMGHKFTHEENRERNKKLWSNLFARKFGIISLKGIYPESMTEESSEESYFVFNHHNSANFYDMIFKMSEYFNQDSFFYKPKDSEVGYLVGTNGSKVPGYNKRGEESIFMLDSASNFMSRIKNKAFAFISPAAIKNKTKEDALSQIDDEISKGEYNQHYWRDENPTSFHERKNKRKQLESFMETLNKRPIDVIEDMHPRTRLCFGQYLRDNKIES